MQIPRVMFAIVCVALGLAITATITVYSQNRTPSVADLTLQKHDLSKMDWVLLNARVTALESTPIQESSHVVSPLDFAYDEASKKIVARGFVNPEWISKANAERMKKIFTMRAIDFCGVAVASALMKEGSAAGLSWQNNCSVRFVTWDTANSNGLSAKDVAFFENGQLVLK